MVGDFFRLADGVGGDGDAAAGVGLDDVNGVVSLEQGQTVPEEGFGRGCGRRLGIGGASALGRLMNAILSNYKNEDIEHRVEKVNEYGHSFFHFDVQ